ncbi:hypothetical protein HPB52_021737 [Rhipicephalus sanguineus]|uniref:CCHC-type domain-containing protein n=1 Tax=Rhipicephalus sanguineus TaxID=34632 RepID=A0A9D4Q8E7_RHISA|nr:hypothetical protein HPB52_021737 [Rhipicephalus sanguineus]
MLVRCSLYRKHVDVCYECGRLGHRPDVCPHLDDKRAEVSTVWQGSSHGRPQLQGEIEDSIHSQASPARAKTMRRTGSGRSLRQRIQWQNQHWRQWRRQRRRGKISVLLSQPDTVAEKHTEDTRWRRSGQQQQTWWQPQQQRHMGTWKQVRWVDVAASPAGGVAAAGRPGGPAFGGGSGNELAQAIERALEQGLGPLQSIISELKREYATLRAENSKLKGEAPRPQQPQQQVSAPPPPAPRSWTPSRPAAAGMDTEGDSSSWRRQRVATTARVPQKGLR